MDGDAVDARRAAWRIIASVEQKERTKAYEQQADDANEYIFVLEGKLQIICAGILALMDENLILSASAEEPKVFYNKTNGDSYRFLEEPVVLQRQAPMIQKVLKTVEFPQVQYVDEIVDEPVVMQGQVPTTQTVPKTVEASQAQFPDRVADVPVVSRRHVPGQLIQEEIVEVIPPPRVCEEIAELNDDSKKSY